MPGSIDKCSKCGGVKIREFCMKCDSGYSNNQDTVYNETLDELVRIVDNPYRPEDSERNHQTFAKALTWIMWRLK